MKVKVIVEFYYGEQMSKDVEQFAKKHNMSIEDVAIISVQSLFDDCYLCADDESYSVSGAELIEE